jgi:glycosyltransferase involved in cell wall biosynthesis
MVAPPWYEVPPAGYGGIERVCAQLADGLSERGHDVTLLAAGADHTRARFVQVLTEPPPGIGTVEHPVQEVRWAAILSPLLSELEVDVVHDHSLAGPLLALGCDRPTLVTAHGPVGGWVGDYYRRLGLPLVALSEAQRVAAPDLPWIGTVANAIEVAEYPFQPAKEGFALFMGRCSREKGAGLALEAAAEAGVPLVLAGKRSEPDEREYFDAHVAPRLGPHATWVGEAVGAARDELLAQASCLVLPAQWEEPFGLVAVEALACGTPVVALRRGALPEIVDHGRTGWLCDDTVELAAALRRCAQLDPRDCRAAAKRRFDASTMVAAYERIYRSVVDARAA